MKIRTGFVSNSSSSSYVIAVLRDFTATPEQLKLFIQECKDNSSENVKRMTPEKAAKVIAEIVDSLCSQETWSWQDSIDEDGEVEGMEHFHSFHSVFKDLIEISDADGGHGCNFLHNILADGTKEKLEKIMKICKCGDNKDENS